MREIFEEDILGPGRSTVNLNKAAATDLARCAAINPPFAFGNRAVGYESGTRIVRHNRTLFVIIDTFRLPCVNFICY